MGRSSNGRLKTNEKTVSIKVRLPESTITQLRKLSKEQEVPTANIIRQGIDLYLKGQAKESK
ncbi:ribbon-helix-helix domain-containing protein [Tissierella sp. DSM 105185]|uniref:Ribbon-helix-helix domain-containing protein n=1 Tax=Tissierella pigra TaxID=2607614 RepID=A0A6N7Y1H4_9FIRM|nr:ribbon-helix-helix domain-containing protein [Tissierella pigra]